MLVAVSFVNSVCGCDCLHSSSLGNGRDLDLETGPTQVVLLTTMGLGLVKRTFLDVKSTIN